MDVTLTPADLIAFEERVARAFRSKEIPFPIHLSGGNERQLIRIFQETVQPGDWVLCSWRAHYHCLLKGVPQEELMRAILNGHSIALCFPEYKILSSAIVGGTAPIAVGLADGLKRNRSGNKVVCFLGDMGYESGIVHESIKYASNRGLPLLWVVEDNSLSVQTDTQQSWRDCSRSPEEKILNPVLDCNEMVTRYHYHLTWPHCGVGEFIRF